MATSSGLFLATIYDQSQLAERKHVARYWLINTVATAVPLSVRAPLSISYYNEISGGHIGWGGCSEEVFCRPSTAPVVVAASQYVTCFDSIRGQSTMKRKFTRN